MDDPIVVERVCKSYGRMPALVDVSFSVPAASVYALVGANGAGKTTLIKLMMNILRPMSGSVRVLGTDSQDLAGKHFEQVGYVSENQEMADWTTVGGMLDYFRPFYPTWDRGLEARLIRQFDLPLKRKLKQLSRGMRMKAAFVSSMAYRPRVMILDEPLSGLDPFVRDELIEGLRKDAPESTILLSSHDLGEIEDFASHVGFIERGRLLFSEEMPVLMERYRAVTVKAPGGIPESWTAPEWCMNGEFNDGAYEFVHAAFQEGSSEAEVRAAMPFAGELTVERMPLRAIFVAIARSNRARRLAAEERDRTAA